MNRTYLSSGQQILARKRSRLVEDDGTELMSSTSGGFGEHRNKRLNCQPIHEFPPSNGAIESPGFNFVSRANITMTPEPLFSSAEQALHQNTVLQSANHSQQIPPHTDSFSHSQNSSTTATSSNAWVGPGPAISHLNGEAHRFPTEMAAVPRIIETEMAWPDAHSQAFSESGLPSPDMILDSGANRMAIPHNHQIDSCMDEEMDFEQSLEHEMPPRMQIPSLQEPSSPPRESGSSPSWKGHNRSRHTVNSWTWQPGMKRSFSLGYCADCEKCRLKVPGHFNHIVIS